MKKNILSVILAAAVMLVATESYASGKETKVAARGYTVHSVIDGRESTTAYDKKGKWVYTIQRYSNDNLDKNIVDKARAAYSDYGVTAIQKIEAPGKDAVYIVNLENKTSIKIIKLVNNDVELVKDLVKG